MTRETFMRHLIHLKIFSHTDYYSLQVLLNHKLIGIVIMALLNYGNNHKNNNTFCDILFTPSTHAPNDENIMKMIIIMMIKIVKKK